MAEMSKMGVCVLGFMLGGQDSIAGCGDGAAIFALFEFDFFLALFSVVKRLLSVWQFGFERYTLLGGFRTVISEIGPGFSRN